MAGTITKYPQSYGDLVLLQPADYGQTMIPPTEVPYDPGTHAGYQPGELHKKDLWQRQFLMLLDVNNPDTFWGKTLKLVPQDVFGSTQMLIEYGDPSQLETSRNFSISGDGTAGIQPFNGTQDVILSLTNVAATSLKTARAFSLTGNVTATAVNFDATGNVILTTAYHDIIPDNLMPAWISSAILDSITSSITTLAGRVTTNEGDITTIFGDITGINNSITSINTSLGTTNSNVAANAAAITTTNNNLATTNTNLATTNANVASNTSAIAGLSGGGSHRITPVVHTLPYTTVASDANKLLLVTGANQTLTIDAATMTVGDIVSIVYNDSSGGVNAHLAVVNGSAVGTWPDPMFVNGGDSVTLVCLSSGQIAILK